METGSTTPGGARRDRGGAILPAHSDPKIALRRSLSKAQNIESGQDLADLMNAVMFDVVSGLLSPGEANAVISAGRQMLRVAEMQLRFREFSARSALLTLDKGDRDA